MGSVKRALGAQELEALRHITDHGPLTVRQMTDQYGAANGLARTTLLTTMENLRKKGYLTREATDNGNVYTAVQPKEQMLETLVQDFVQKSLAGSLSPFVAYITRSRGLSDQEVDQLKQLVQELDKDGGKREPQP